MAEDKPIIYTRVIQYLGGIFFLLKIDLLYIQGSFYN